MSTLCTKILKTWAVIAASGLLLAAHADFDDDFDLDFDVDIDFDSDFDDDDTGGDSSSCTAPYGTTYYGYALNAEGEAIATVRVREARVARKASSRVTIFVTDLETRVQTSYVAYNCAIPTASIARPLNNANDTRFIKFAIDWNGVIGTCDDGTVIKASASGANSSQSVSIDSLVVLKGYHSLALEAVAPELDGTTNGYLTVSLNVKAKGRYTAAVTMPNGWRFSQSGKLTAEGDFLKASLLKSRKYLKGTELVAFDILLDPTGYGSTITNALKWTSTSPQCNFSRELRLVGIGSPTLTTTQFKQMNAQVGLESATVKTLKLTAKTGIVSGTFTYPVINARGKISNKRGTIRGIDVNGTVYATGYILKKMDFPIFCQE